MDWWRFEARVLLRSVVQAGSRGGGRRGEKGGEGKAAADRALPQSAKKKRERSVSPSFTVGGGGEKRPRAARKGQRGEAEPDATYEGAVSPPDSSGAKNATSEPAKQAEEPPSAQSSNSSKEEKGGAVAAPAARPRPQSPPPGPPSGVTLALVRLSDLTSQMEFAYAKQLKLQREHEVVKAKIRVLKGLPVGIDAYREELNALITEDHGKMPAVRRL